MKFEVILTVEVDPQAPFFDSTGQYAKCVEEQFEQILYDQDDVHPIEIEVQEC